MQTTLEITYSHVNLDPTNPKGYTETPVTFTKEFRSRALGLPAEVHEKKFLVDWANRGYYDHGDEKILWHKVIKITRK